jgi:hypothetical protein
MIGKVSARRIDVEFLIRFDWTKRCENVISSDRALRALMRLRIVSAVLTELSAHILNIN